ncbi:Magnesium-chelatase 38 kDa subunit [Paenibacillus konkukensis]|uniref:Mg-protoporphyrin IX chelatase n=1 Tax=Paenibacillus konkukensis TaxID=2020716 RepID=A0ABY4RGF6_9BACL|nr:VWA domain-containing protein [Paenibacillus konkukensis]UQZ81541.1 Magnesium-chelatase 38 kDa subunit [Paenibacillus konkukensis]
MGTVDRGNELRMKRQAIEEAVAASLPFCAVEGQDRAKRALLLLAVHPGIGGLLLQGAPGTGKSVLARGLSRLLPEDEAAGPWKELPAHASEDRIAGSADWEEALRSGSRRAKKGLLAEADGGFLYIDAVNLLDDSALRIVLNAAASGQMELQREGVSAVHASRIALIACMDPGEGELPASVRDRFAIGVTMETVAERERRCEIIRRTLAFEANRAAFAAGCVAETEALRKRIAAARLRLPHIAAGRAELELAAAIAQEAGCDGHRAELALIGCARAAAAWEGCRAVEARHVQEAAAYALPHRMKRGGPEADAAGTDKPRRGETGGFARPAERAKPPAEPERAGACGETAEHRAAEEQAGRRGESRAPLDRSGSAGQRRAEREQDASAASQEHRPATGDMSRTARETVAAIGGTFEVRQPDWASPPSPKALRAASGKRDTSLAGTRQGRYVGASVPIGKPADLALDATLRAAAPYQRMYAEKERALVILPEHIRMKERRRKCGSTILFVVDASGSMGVRERMKAVKGAVLSLLKDAYLKRDRVGMVAFRGRKAELALDITRSVELAERCLREMPTGGKTPLAHALRKGGETLAAEMRKRREVSPILVLLSDCRANEGIGEEGMGTKQVWEECVRIGRAIAAAQIPLLIVDTEQGPVQLGQAHKLARSLGARYLKLEQLEGERIAAAVRKLM